MKRFDRGSRSVRGWAALLCGLVLIATGFYFFGVSAKQDVTKEPVLQELAIGKLAFSTAVFGPTSPDPRIVVTNPDGTNGGPLPIPTSLGPTQPAWSPDGMKIAFTSGQGQGDIYSTNLDGTEQINLTNTASPILESNPSWSATGKIAYERGNQIWTMNANGTEQAAFTAITQPSPKAPAWSPDGSRLAFASAGEIWVIDADGTDQQRVTTNGTTDNDPTWAPDGTKIAFGRGSGISVINVDGTNEIPLNNSGSAPSWSPDGTKIAYRGGASGGGIYTMDASGTNQVRVSADIILFPQCCDTVKENPAWQITPQVPNTFTVSGRITSNNGLPVAGVTVNLSGSMNAATTTDNIGNYQFSGLQAGGSFTVSPSLLNHHFTPPNRTFDNLLANQNSNFSASRVCIGLACAENGKIAFNRGNDIWTINQNGTGATNITNNPAEDSAPEWSPDGVKILFTTNRDGNSEIYRMNAEDDNNPTRLTNNPAADTSARYSPDGNSIVFVSSRDGNSEIYKMNADGSNQVRLTNDTASEGLPSFSPDGQWIIWTRQNPVSPFGTTLYRMNADGSDKQPLFGPANFLTSPSYSPDGTKIIMVFGVDVTQQTIYVINSDGTGIAQAGIGRNQPAWSADGTKIIHYCCFFQGPTTPNGLWISQLGGPLGPRLTSGEGDGSPDWQPIPTRRRVQFDFDSDGKADPAIFRPSTNTWWYLSSFTNTHQAAEWGESTDKLVPADYDGDLKTDVAVWRPSTGNFHVLNSFNFTVRTENFGLDGDIPTGGDFDGDSKADLAVYRPGPQGVFYYRASMGNPNGDITFVPWGIAGDKPVVGDYDGDGRSDAAVYRDGTWYARQSSNGQMYAVQWGLANDRTVQADYDNDGKTDVAVYRDGTWYVLRSTHGFWALQFGITGDSPVPADYDGDGKADVAIFRQGAWWILKSGSGPEVINFGLKGDVPVLSTYVR